MQKIRLKATVRIRLPTVATSQEMKEIDVDVILIKILVPSVTSVDYSPSIPLPFHCINNHYSVHREANTMLHFHMLHFYRLLHWLHIRTHSYIYVNINISSIDRHT